MGKSFLIILGLYLLYYTGNIIYDLFLKKEEVIETENSEQSFSLSELAEQNQNTPISVGIEDVETLSTPKSFEKEEYDFLSINQEPKNLEELQKKYEDENQLYEEDKTHLGEQSEEKQSIVDKPIKSLRLQDIVNDINTRIKLVANYEGQKVYHIHRNVNPN
ncbi:hypothetical protein PG593_03555 [Riemerella anatipestifer]|uniref:hypothetical protein n=1 Tax=Riemerella anatipestifer TaxID=34085 RepID=UPI000B14E513|nr:hypothetical protein [Riemerella anatipestifer]MDR7693404.1 hypothetical protein [Riemerella anatipestifer]MDY3528855.1 hypothetical protein [Riemerella anatipestifer]MDY3538070.1 hypothetical protein [Riemerella anatipestifer]